MTDVFHRAPQNPLLTPASVPPSMPGMVVECLLNPGAFRYQGRIGLLLRVSERPVQEAGWVSTPVLDDNIEGGIRILKVRLDEPTLRLEDSRGFEFQGQGYLTTLSHLRLAWSDDGIHFTVDSDPLLLGEGDHESFGIEDCRVEFIDDRYWLTYTAVSPYGVAVGLISTVDWKHFDRHGIIFPPHNKDCGLFPENIRGKYWAFHRPSSIDLGGNYIWTSASPDMLHWGEHRCIARTRSDCWDSQRIGAGAAPIRTDAGWLVIYHGANFESRYCLGLMLLDLGDPTKVLARSRKPILEPTTDYERNGFFGHVVFTNGHIVDGDRVTMYYGAADSVICMAQASLRDLLTAVHDM